MKYLTIFYLFLFITHITLGPYYITYLLQFKKPKWASKNITEVLCIYAYGRGVSGYVKISR